MELTKEYFDEQLEKLATKEAVNQLAETVQELQSDMQSVKSDVSEIKTAVFELSRRDIEDSDAFAKTLVNHDRRLQTLESSVKELKLKAT